MWHHRVKIKHLMTDEEAPWAVRASMNVIADALDKQSCFQGFNTDLFRSIPRGDDFFAPVDYANKLIDRMYDYAGAHSIWIE